jgi:hypothetical protein
MAKRETLSVNFTADGKDIAQATLSALVAVAMGQYTALLVALRSGPAAVNVESTESKYDELKASGDASLPLAARQAILRAVFDDVASHLPLESPFRDPLARVATYKVDLLK